MSERCPGVAAACTRPGGGRAPAGRGRSTDVDDAHDDQGTIDRNPDAITRPLGLTNDTIHVPPVRPSLLRSEAKNDALEALSIASGARSGFAVALSLISIFTPVPSTGASALPAATIGVPAFARVVLSATANVVGS